MKVSSDVLMENTFKYLQEDLRSYTDWPELSIEQVRDFDFSFRFADPYRIKAKAQVVSFLKRYRFKNDRYSDEELEALTNQKFMSDQLRVGKHFALSYRAAKVIRHARGIIRNVLGRFDESEIHRFCRFSQNGVVGFKGDDVYLDQKINPDTPLTGTVDEGKWFFHHISDDPLLSFSVMLENGARPALNLVSSLKQVNVPKTALIMRPVRPNTLIGSYRSLGLGGLIVERIKSGLGVELSHLQPLHQDLARIGSRTMKNVTADLSSASDSFTPSLLNMLLPRDWYNALKLGRTPYFSLAEKEYYSPSFMAMGIGFTFPTMTLMFHAMLLSLQHFTKIAGRISVFGDDLIYPRGLHPYVLAFFRDINFKINEEKTFADIPFRESCGGDFYDGIDVRPARPKGVSELLEGSIPICAYVYKLFNSLIRRWEEVELPLTFRYLRSVVELVTKSPCYVPSHFPDSSGFKDGSWRTRCRKEPEPTDRRKPFYQGVLIDCLIERSHLRPCGFQNIYLWETLQGRIDREVYTTDRDVLIWRKAKNRRPPSKGGLRKMVAFTSKRRTCYFNLSCLTFNG